MQPSAGGPAAATTVHHGPAGRHGAGWAARGRLGKRPQGRRIRHGGGLPPPQRTHRPAAGPEAPKGAVEPPPRARRTALRAVREALLRRLPRVVGRGVALPAHQVEGPATEGLAVEERLHDTLALLPRVRDRAGRVRPARARVVGLEPVDVDRWAALGAAREGQRVRIRASDGSHAGGALPPWTELADLGGVEQLPGPQQHLVAHLDSERRVHPTRAQRRLALLLRRVRSCLEQEVQSLGQKVQATAAWSRACTSCSEAFIRVAWPASRGSADTPAPETRRRRKPGSAGAGRRHTWRHT